MSSSHFITLLHLSDLRFGRYHRFGRLALASPEDSLDAVLGRLGDDLRKLREEHDLRPDLLILTGDLTQSGLRSEFQDALRLIEGITDLLRLPRNQVGIVPGNHDVNRKACQAYFMECEADEQKPVPPYWPKWRHYGWLFHEVYNDHSEVRFTEEEPWSLFVIPNLNVVVAGLNSTMAESHRPQDHYGYVGNAQLRWFADLLEEYREKGWLRIGAVHHNVRQGPVVDEESLRDVGDLRRVLGNQINVLLHGHTHDGEQDWLSSSIPILATGSVALTRKIRPENVPNQYQVVRIWQDRFCRWTRIFTPDRKRWNGDLRASDIGDRWWNEQATAFQDVWPASLDEPMPEENVQREDPRDVLLPTLELSPAVTPPTFPAYEDRVAEALTPDMAG